MGQWDSRISVKAGQAGHDRAWRNLPVKPAERTHRPGRWPAPRQSPQGFRGCGTVTAASRSRSVPRKSAHAW